MLLTEDIYNLQKLLAEHRDTLILYLEQEANHGSLDVPSKKAIRKTRANIRGIKQVLRENGIEVDDKPFDEDFYIPSSRMDVNPVLLDYVLRNNSKTSNYQTISSYFFSIPLLAAILAAIVLLLVVVPKTPLQSNSDITPTSISGFTVTIVNHLRLPIRLQVADVDARVLEGGATADIPIDKNSVDVSFTVIKQKNTAGEELGDDMSGVVNNVQTTNTIDITNVIGEQRYFFPIVDSRYFGDCKLRVNEGLPYEIKRDVLISGQSSNVGIGYYKLSEGSNIVVYCENEVSVFGIKQDKGGTNSLLPFVQPQSGTTALIIKPK